MQIDLARLEAQTVENGMKINLGKRKGVSFTGAWMKDLLNYSLLDQEIPKVSCCKYLRIILCSDLSWTDHVTYTAKKAWKALHFTMCILKKGKSNMKSLAYMSLVGLILEYKAACWDPFSKGQINVLDQVHKKVICKSNK